MMGRVHGLLTGWVWTLLVASVAGCETKSPRPFPNTRDGFDRIECESDRWQGLRSLALERPADAITWRLHRGGEPHEIAPLAGEPCSKASDRAGCQLAWQRAGTSLSPREHPECGAVDCVRYFVINRGDSVEVKSEDEMLPEIAPIDTAADATLVALLARYGMPCRGDEGGFVRSVPGGFELIGYKIESRVPESLTDTLPEFLGAVIQYFGPTDSQTVLLRVARNGTVDELARKPLELE